MIKEILGDLLPNDIEPIGGSCHCGCECNTKTGSSNTAGTAFGLGANSN